MAKSTSEPAPPFDVIEWSNLFRIGEWQDRIEWQPYRDGVEIHRLYGDGVQGPTAVLLRYGKCGVVPWHRHEGYEHLLVLVGSQKDQNGEIHAGTLRINPPGTSHEVHSDAGCIVLAIYEKPVRFVADASSSGSAPASGG